MELNLNEAKGSAIVAIMNKILAVLALFLVQSSVAQGINDPLIPWSPTVFLGMSPGKALNALGVPERVFPVRGLEAWQDDVVFEFLDGLSLFLFDDKVWQVRISDPYSLPVLGFILGGTEDQLTKALGFPPEIVDGDLEWKLTGEAWPIRLRAIISEGGSIREIYVYRADF